MISRRAALSTSAVSLLAYAIGVRGLVEAENAVARVSRVLHSRLTTVEIRGAVASIEARGWKRENLPELSTLRADISQDFRNGNTVLANRVRFSKTEAAWYLLSRSA